MTIASTRAAAPRTPCATTLSPRLTLGSSSEAGDASTASSSSVTPSSTVITTESPVLSAPCIPLYTTTSSVSTAPPAVPTVRATDISTTVIDATTATTLAAVPTETHFPNREELLQYVHTFALDHGYAVVTHKSNVPRGQLWLRCDLGGSYRSATATTASTTTAPSTSLESTGRKRKCSSRLQNCPFQLYARRLPGAQWVLKVQHSSHNHAVDATDTPAQLTAHPIARRLTLEQKQLVDDLTRRGARPKQVLATLQTAFPDKPLKVQDIYNTRNFLKSERRAGREPFATRSGNSSSRVTSNELTPRSERVANDVSHIGPVMPPAVQSNNNNNNNSSSTRTNQQQHPPLAALLCTVDQEFEKWQPQTQQHFIQNLQALVASSAALDTQSIAAVAVARPSTCEPVGVALEGTDILKEPVPNSY